MHRQHPRKAEIVPHLRSTKFVFQINSSRMTTTSATPVIRSWAQIVQTGPEDTTKMQKGIRPAKRGSLLRFCRGEVVKMLQNYGWLMVYGSVDHPSVEKRGGDVYIHKDDVVVDESLSPGDVVTFYLYADDQGLGAEECRVEQKAASHFNPNAGEFVPSGAKSTLNVCAKEFVMPTIDEFVDIQDVADVYSRLSNCLLSLDDDESDSDNENPDEEVSAGLTFGSSCKDMDDMANVFLCLPKASSSDSEEEYDEGDGNATTPWKAKRAPSSAGSTSGGETNDFEEDISASDSSDSETDASREEPTAWSKRLPLGMALPIQFRPPPGLELELAF